MYIIYMYYIMNIYIRLYNIYIYREILAVRRSPDKRNYFGRGFTSVTQQTCLLCDTTVMSAV